MPMPVRIFGRRPRGALSEDIDAKRSAERTFVKAYDTTESNLWYLVDTDWLAEWKGFLNGGAHVPGPISNHRLLDSNGRARAGLIRVVNYRGVNAAVWGYLHGRYGGGPELPRSHLDIYSEPVHISKESSSLLADDGDSQVSPASPPSSDSNQGSVRSGRSRIPAVLRRLSRSRSGSLAARVPRTLPISQTLTSSSHEKDGCVFFVNDAAANITEQPKDGSCLFHAMCHGLQENCNASLLRLEISKYIVDHPDMLIAGTALAEWVQHDSGDGVNNYATKMAGGEWGGGIEMEVAAHLKGVNVHVYEKCSGGYQRIAAFNLGDQGAQTVNVLYQGRNHYDAMDLSSNAGKWVPRAQCESRL